MITQNEIYKGIAPKIKEINPVGSGDALVGAFLTSLDKGDNLENAFKWGIAAGTANASKWAIGSLDLKEMNNYFDKVVIQKV